MLNIRTFVEVVVWRLPRPARVSAHKFKYRLALIADGVYVLRYDKAISLKPYYAEAYNNRGAALNDLKRPAHELVSYDKAIALKPDCTSTAKVA